MPTQFNRALAKPTVVRAYLRLLGLRPNGTDDENLDRLIQHQQAQRPESLVECDQCYGVSHEELATCPYCGSAEGNSVPPPDVDSEPAGEEPAPTTTENDMATKKTEKKASAPKEKKAAKKPAAKADVKKAEKKPASTALAKAQPTKVEKAIKAPKTEVLTIKMLNDEVAAIEKNQKIGGAALFEVGRHLAIIERQGLYALRLGADKQPKYKTFGDFTQAELDITKKYAQRLIDVTERFKEADVRKIGVSKLFILASIKPGEEFDHLMDVARSGATREAIEAEVKRLAPDRSGNRDGWKGDTSNRGTRTRSEPVEPPTVSDGITVIAAEPVSTFDLKRKGDGYVAVEKSANGVKIEYAVACNENGEPTVLTVTRKR